MKNKSKEQEKKRIYKKGINVNRVMLIRVKCSGLFSAGCKCSDTSHQGLSAYDQSYVNHPTIYAQSTYSYYGQCACTYI